MAALAYVLPPLSGLFAYLKGRSPETRVHGLQAVVLGAAWPASIYAGSAVSPGLAQLAFVAGALLWVVLLLAVLVGRGLVLSPLRRLVEDGGAGG